LSKCLGSLLIEDQELFQKLDVIVVNDGSKDRTSEIAHDFEQRCPGVFRVIDKPNGNYGSCINVGLKVAVGTFVKVLDADDSYETSGFEKFVSTIRRVEATCAGRVDAFVTDFHWTDENDKVYATTTYQFPANEILALSDERVCLDRLIYMHALAYRTENLRKIDYRQTEGVCFTDNEWIFEPFCMVKFLYYAPVPVYRYLNGREGQSTDQSIALRQVWMFDKVVESLVSRFAHWRNAVSPKVQGYWRGIVLDVAQYVYQIEILRIHTAESDARLAHVDKRLRSSWPELYETIGQMTFTNKLPVKFVAWWRKTCSCRSVGMKLFIVVAKIVIRHCHKQQGATS